MHEHSLEDTKNGNRVAIVGNPNVGKSVIFGLLTGRYATVSNYPGTTVTLTSGSCKAGGEDLWVTDTPGVNTLIPMSEDEVVTRDILLNQAIKLVVQVADAKNPSRGLQISLQLAEMGLPFMLVLNMWDEANSRGIDINVKKLSDAIGTTVIPTIGVQRKGIKELRESLTEERYSSLSISYGNLIEDGIKKLEAILPQSRISRRSIALMLLAGDASLKPWLNKNVSPSDVTTIDAIRRDLQNKFYEPLGYVINQIRLKKAEKIVEGVLSRHQKSGSNVTVHIGKWAMHPVWGIPVLLAALFLMYEFVGVLGAQVLVGLLEEGLFGNYINPYMTFIAERFIPDLFFRDLFVGEYGIITMALTYSIALILPIVGTFFIAFGILEDSGYLPRLAIMVHKIFKLMGLHGKAVLPMVLGLGCDTMATFTARVMETRKERVIVTLLLALGVPCSAQLGVILGMLSDVGPVATIAWVGLLAGIILVVGYLAAKVIPGESSDFILEIPPIRWPQVGNLAVKTMARIEWYLREAVPLFLLGTFLLFAADRLGGLVRFPAPGEPLFFPIPPPPPTPPQ